MPFLERVELLDPGADLREEFPFSVPSIAAHLGASVSFASAVTFLVGENGSGKSTFLEGIACAVDLPGIGSDNPDSDPTLVHGRTLANAMKLRWELRHPHRGYYFRAEDFFGFTKQMDSLKARLLAEADEMRNDLARSHYARELGAGVLFGQARAIEARYGASGLDSRSHGEQFLDLFSARYRPDGIYLMDEPEAPLSPAQTTYVAVHAEGDGGRRLPIHHRHAFAHPAGAAGCIHSEFRRRRRFVQRSSKPWNTCKSCDRFWRIPKPICGICSGRVW